jgi:hypothetical protein
MRRRLKRAQILLAADAGCSDAEISRTVVISTPTWLNRWGRCPRQLASAGGVAFIIASAGISSATPTISWPTGGITADYSVGNLAGNSNQLGSGHATASGSVTVQSTADMSYAGGEILYAAWGQ